MAAKLLADLEQEWFSKKAPATAGEGRAERGSDVAASARAPEPVASSASIPPASAPTANGASPVAASAPVIAPAAPTDKVVLIGFEAARSLAGVSRNKLYSMVRAGKVPGVRMRGSRWAFDRAQLMAFFWKADARPVLQAAGETTADVRPLLSFREARDVVGVGAPEFFQLISNGHIRAIKTGGGRLWFDLIELQAYVERSSVSAVGQVGSAGDIPKAPPIENEAAYDASIARALRAIGDWTTMRVVMTQVGGTEVQVRRALLRLIGARQVERVGDRGSTRYRIVDA